MGGGGSIAAMIASIKSNKRKRKKSIYDKSTSTYSKRTPLSSKKLTSTEKQHLLNQLQADRLSENKLRKRKLVITLIITCIVISVIIYLVKWIFM